MGLPNTVLDADDLSQCHADLTFDNGFVFTFLLRLFIGALGIVGIFALISGGPGYIIGPIPLLIASYALTAKHGTQVSLENQYIRSYSSSYGIKRGKWKPTHNYPDISILKMGKPLEFAMEGHSSKLTIDKETFDIYLLSKSHRQRLYITSIKSSKDAFVFAENLATDLDKELVKFNPVISQATLNRRYNRY